MIPAISVALDSFDQLMRRGPCLSASPLHQVRAGYGVWMSPASERFSCRLCLLLDLARGIMIWHFYGDRPSYLGVALGASADADPIFLLRRADTIVDIACRPKRRVGARYESVSADCDDGVGESLRAS